MLHSRMLVYLDEVARAGSIRRAAERLNVAASSINRQIIDFEAELGTPIFERLPRGLRLTAAGEILITHIRNTLRDHERTRFRIRELEGVGRGTIAVGTANGLASGFFPLMCQRFASAFPGIRFEIKNLVHRDIVQAVDDGEVAFGLGYNLLSSAGSRTVAAFSPKLGVVAAAGHPLSKQASVRLSDLADYPLALSDESLSVHPILDNAAKAAKVELRATFETNSVQSMKYLVQSGDVVTVLSAPDVMAEVNEGSLVHLPISDQMPANELRLIQRVGQVLSPSAALFVESVRTELNQIAG